MIDNMAQEDADMEEELFEEFEEEEVGGEPTWA